MSERGLYKPVKATLNLSGLTAINTTVTNVLLAKMVLGGNPKPNPAFETIKKVSERIIDNVMNRIQYGELTKGEIAEFAEIAEAYKSVLKIL
jgi:hypothetical protein